MTSHLTEEEEKAKNLGKLKNKQEMMMVDLEGELTSSQILQQFFHSCFRCSFTLLSCLSLTGGMDEIVWNSIVIKYYFPLYTIYSHFSELFKKTYFKLEVKTWLIWMCVFSFSFFLFLLV